MLINIILFFLGKGIAAGYKLDDEIRQDILSIPEGFVVKLQTYDKNHSLVFWLENGKIFKKNGKKAQKINENLLIEFKSNKIAKQILFGKVSIKEAFAKHYFVVYGDIFVATKLVRVLERVENYLFPNIIKKKIFNEKMRKQVSSFKFYTKVLLGV